MNLKKFYLLVHKINSNSVLQSSIGLIHNGLINGFIFSVNCLIHTDALASDLEEHSCNWSFSLIVRCLSSLNC